MDYLRFVNPLQGTDSNGGLSKGNTEPIVAMPFGMAHWTLQTDDYWGWQFRPHSPKLQGIRLTHQPSPWMGDYGAFLITPQSGIRIIDLDERSTPWKLDEAEIHPHWMRGLLSSSGVGFDFVPTERGAIAKFTFPEGLDSRILLQGIKGESEFEVLSDVLIAGRTNGNSGGVPHNFACHLVVRLDQPILGSKTYTGNEAAKGGESRTGDRFGVSLELGRSRSCTLRIGTSFISQEQALVNLHREIGDSSLETIRRRGERRWQQLLGQIEILDADERDLRTFYSCFYRTKLFPRMWHEFDPNGKEVHFSPYDGQVHAGPLYADTGFWDTYRTQHPLMTLLEPNRQAEMIRGFISAYEESGWMPQWPSPGHRVSMPGTHLDATIADAVAKGITGFDVQVALRGMLQHADHANRGGPFGAGRADIEDYIRLGYCIGNGAVAQTLDYAYDDWAISTVAHFLGKQDVEQRMLLRAGNWRHVYDPSVGFMRPKNADGKWDLVPFDPLYWGGPYCEGGPWQSSWAVQHDLAGLMKAMGGEGAFAAKLDEMLATPPDFHVGGYGQVIHEMTEMKIAHFGQYAHSNQPVHACLYMYQVAGRPWRTQKEVRRVMAELYSPEAFAGDEDNGEMAAWYVLSSIGIYPLCPGRPEWVLGSPAFRRVKIHLPNGKSLAISAPDNRPENVYVDAVSLNGHLRNESKLSHSDLVNGGNLHFHMSAVPFERVTPIAGRPSSLSPYTL